MGKNVVLAVYGSVEEMKALERDIKNDGLEFEWERLLWHETEREKMEFGGSSI
jgi:hypothetical protein